MIFAAPPATGKRPVPWAGVVALVVAVASGMLVFPIGGAPTLYAALNGLALLLGLVIIAIFPAHRMNAVAATSIVALGAACVAATLVSGFDLEGVRRWLPLGPARLHAAMLFLPMITVLMPRLSGNVQVAVMAVLAAVFAIQPDRASALALATGFALSRPVNRDYPVTGLGILVALGAITITWCRADPLDPVRFVEGVVPLAFGFNPLLGLLTVAALLFACAAPLHAVAVDARAARGLAGVTAGFTLASAIGAYPAPFIGYGASPILGYALALAFLRVPIVPPKAG